MACPLSTTFRVLRRLPPIGPRLRSVALFAMLASSWAGLAVAAGQPVHQEVPRHPLELRALVDPAGVLGELRAWLKKAEGARDYRELALLRVAQANACRVKADWTCQRDAGVQARLAAEAGGLPVLAEGGGLPVGEGGGRTAEPRGRI